MKNKLICPYCEGEFEHTVKRYFRMPFGKFTCPECGEVSKLLMRSGKERYYHASLFGVVLIFAALGISLIEYLGLPTIFDSIFIFGLIVAGIVGMFGFFYGDLLYENRFKVLKKFEEEEIEPGFKSHIKRKWGWYLYFSLMIVGGIYLCSLIRKVNCMEEPVVSLESVSPCLDGEMDER